jgi:glycosyltransferase involved in cell wall biosynthesis
VDMYLAGLGEFARPKLEAGGIPPDRLVLKPNFIPDPGSGAGDGGYAAFVGRLDPQKGIEFLLRAWSELDMAVPLKIIGDGPLAPLVKEAAQNNPAIEWLGQRTPDEVLSVLKRAAVMVCASRSYEGQPRSIVEALAVGTPVLAPRLGAMQSMVSDGLNGALFDPLAPRSLAAQVRRLFSEPELLRRMREGSRRDYLVRYTEDISYAMMMDVYRKARSFHDAAAQPPRG